MLLEIRKLWILMALALAGFGSGVTFAQPQEPAADQPGSPTPQSPQPPEQEAPSPLLDEPQTPAELLEATDLMLRLARPNLARQYLQQFLNQNVDDDTFLQLSDRFGPAFFLKLANAEALQPLSTQLLARVTQAYRARGASDDRIDALIDRLAGAPGDRETAVRTLRSLGAVVVPRFIARISDPKYREQQEVLLQALIRIGRSAVPPLLAALEAAGTHVPTAAIEVLGWIGAPEAIPYLWYPAFSSDVSPDIRTAALQALKRLNERVHPGASGQPSLFGVVDSLQAAALQQFAYKYPWPDTEEGTVEIWTWDGASNNVQRLSVSPETASLTTGLRFARQALSLGPDNEQLQALFLGLTLAQARQLAGPDGPLPVGSGTAHDLALTAGVPLVAQTLDLALENGNAAAGEAALQVLGQIATVPELVAAGKDSPLLKALDSPDRQVQFAAAVAVMDMNPTARFPGAERVVAVFMRALRNAERSAVIVDANAARANQVAALIGEMGYVPQIAQTGQDGFRAASSRMDVDLVVLNINTIRWPLSLTVANLRADARTAKIPIAIYGPDNMRDRVASLLERYDAVIYVIDARASEEFDSQLRPMLQNIRAPQLSEEQRAQQRTTAAYWLADIASRKTDVFDLRPAEGALLGAVQDPSVSENILLTLSALPSTGAQQALHQIAVSPSFPAAMRQSAALQLAYHIQRFDLLLSAEQIAQLRSSWETAEQPELATALASVLGTLKPNSRQIGLRLKEFAPAP